MIQAKFFLLVSRNLSAIFGSMLCIFVLKLHICFKQLHVLVEGIETKSGMQSVIAYLITLPGD